MAKVREAVVGHHKKSVACPMADNAFATTLRTVCVQPAPNIRPGAVEETFVFGKITFVQVGAARPDASTGDKATLYLLHLALGELFAME
jgi:hypothetical protein